ncbi:jg8928 [Pararge aegeria aegeria]|uniref:Jg8928 protein n=1 Tax=Pararge aegeria aegeria TaxID=348720 RepID=A0A8S4SID5_9NEOP|nr:jg8928 [Pararge aegeria aegeria]
MRGAYSSENRLNSSTKRSAGKPPTRWRDDIKRVAESCCTVDPGDTRPFYLEFPAAATLLSEDDLRKQKARYDSHNW